MATISPINFCTLRNPIMADDSRVQSSHCCRLNRIEAFPASQFQIKNDWKVPLSSRMQCFRDSAIVKGDSWENTVLNCETVVLVEFHASWCGPCRMVHRVIDEIALEYSGRLKCFMLDTDHDIHIADRYGIKVVPVILLFKKGHKCETVVGTMPKEFYVAAIERVLSS